MITLNLITLITFNLKFQVYSKILGEFKKIPNKVWNIYEMQQHDQLWGSEDQQCSKISHFEYFQKQKNEGFISCGISIGFRKPYQIWDITESQREKLFLFCKKFLKVQNPDF